MARNGYIVELEIEPGGMRRHDIVVVGTSKEVRTLLEVELENEDEDALDITLELMAAGMAIRVHAVIDGVVKPAIDLRAFITATDGAFTVDWQSLHDALPQLAAIGVRHGEELELDDAEALYFLDRPVMWGYVDLVGDAETPHLAEAFAQ